MGVVHNPGSTSAMQALFHNEGYFMIRVMPLGANLFLIEELEKGELGTLMKEGQDWLNL